MARKTVSAKNKTTKTQKDSKRAGRISKASSPAFLTFKFTQQTVYWFILSALVLALGLWVTYLTIKVQRIYDQVEASSAHQSYDVIKRQ